MAEQTSFELDHDHNINRHDFPLNFMFGVGTSAYQVEGAWNRSGKGLNMWDCTTLRHPEIITGGANGCVAVDHYSKMKEDVHMLKKMGVNYYRFSLSWSRILPGGKVCMGKNLEAIDHYNKLIDELKANGIEPFVTLFHWDLPNALEEEYMGFLSSKIVDDFVNYADLCFWEFGDRVKNWVTLNEPHSYCSMASNENGDPETDPYTVAYNLLNCHAAAYRKYHKDYKDIQHGKVGITLDINFFKPDNPSSQQDAKAVEYAYDFVLGWFMEPLTSGTWPENIQKFATTPTTKHPNGRVLPKFSDDQLNKLIHSYDFLGINYYTANYAQYQAPSPQIPLGYATDCHYKGSGQNYAGDYIGETAFEGSWVYLCPHELVELLSLIKKKYHVTKDIVITENGSQDKNDSGKTYEQTRDDSFRIKYIKAHLEAIRTVRRMKINVTGYFVWSFMDSFEWSFGYSVRFGLIYVDYNNNLLRYPKNSAIWFKKFLLETNKGHLKRTITDGEQEDHELNDARAVEVIAKLKKARA